MKTIKVDSDRGVEEVKEYVWNSKELIYLCDTIIPKYWDAALVKDEPATFVSEVRECLESLINRLPFEPDGGWISIKDIFRCPECGNIREKMIAINNDKTKAKCINCAHEWKI